MLNKLKRLKIIAQKLAYSKYFLYLCIVIEKQGYG